jgi:hypothetical protein
VPRARACLRHGRNETMPTSRPSLGESMSGGRRRRRDEAGRDRDVPSRPAGTGAAAPPRVSSTCWGMALACRFITRGKRHPRCFSSPSSGSRHSFGSATRRAFSCGFVGLCNQTVLFGSGILYVDKSRYGRRNKGQSWCRARRRRATAAKSAGRGHILTDTQAGGTSVLGEDTY